MARYATYIRSSTVTQETVHQHDAINDWHDNHDAGPDDVDRYADLGEFTFSVFCDWIRHAVEQELERR